MADTPRRPRQHVKFTPAAERRAAERTAAPEATAPRAAPGGAAARAPAGPPPKARISVSRPEKAGSMSPAIVGAALLIAALVALGLYSLGGGPDPHFLAATKLLKDYELGRAEEARNYGNPIYDRALAELQLVATDSVSFDEANALRNDLVVRREAFFGRLRDETRATDSRQQLYEKKMAELTARQRRSRLHPQLEYPECEE